MIRIVLFLTLIGLAGRTPAQTGTITGKITDSKTGQPISQASVFLSNATVGGKSGDTGEYRLGGIKTGTYDLVVSIIGYTQFTQQVHVTGTALEVNASLVPRIIQMQEIVLKPDPNWLNNYNAFKRYLFGPSPNAVSCSILNPKEVSVSFERPLLTASSEDFIEIENKALGYKLKYLLNAFEVNYTTGSIYYAGQVFFEELPGKDSEKKRWKKNRELAYYGSSMHFFRSLRNNTTDEAGFALFRLVRKPNPARLPDSLINANVKRLRAAKVMQFDSLSYWQGKLREPAIIQYLIKQPLKADSLVKPAADGSANGQLSFSDYLVVAYTKKTVPMYSLGGHSTEDALRNPATILAMQNLAILFDSNGIVIDPRSVIFEGVWSDGVANLLPYDYEPEKK